MPDKPDNRPLKTYVVEGTKYGEFPMDMLRRDDALPYGQDNAKLVDRLNFMGDGKGDLPKKVRVTLCSKSKFAPNVARWESFGWRVVESSDPTVILSAPTSGEKIERGDPDALRQKTMQNLAQAVLTLRGKVHMADPTYDALRYAGDVAAQDKPYRQQAIGFCEGVHRALTTPGVPGLADRSDLDALTSALTLARDLLMREDGACRDLCRGEAPIHTLAKLLKIEMMFK
jgi:hypothetical protein